MADAGNHNLMRLQRHASPIPRDVAKHSVLDLVPLAGSRRIMAHFDDHARLVGELLQLQLPKPITRTIAAAAIGCDQQTSPSAVLLPAKLPPPESNGGHGELSRIVANSHRDERLVAMNIVHAIGNGLAFGFVGKVVRVSLSRTALGFVFSPHIALVSQRFLLFRIPPTKPLRRDVFGL